MRNIVEQISMHLLVWKLTDEGAPDRRMPGGFGRIILSASDRWSWRWRMAVAPGDKGARA